MTGYSKRVTESTLARKAMDDLGAEPLAGSGFEAEVPEEGFGEEVEGKAQLR